MCGLLGLQKEAKATHIMGMNINYEHINADSFWDGRRQNDGAECESGTYFYVNTRKEQTLDAEPVEWRGDVTLLREE